MKRRSDIRARVLILGGGFAGLAPALELRADRHRVTLVDQRRGFEFLPNIHELLSGVKTPELLRLPLDRAVQRAGHVFVRDVVTAIDPAARAVSTQRRRSAIGYDALIVALGGVDATRTRRGRARVSLQVRRALRAHRLAPRAARRAPQAGACGHRRRRPRRRRA